MVKIVKMPLVESRQKMYWNQWSHVGIWNYEAERHKPKYPPISKIEAFINMYNYHDQHYALKQNQIKSVKCISAWIDQHTVLVLTYIIYHTRLISLHSENQSHHDNLHLSNNKLKKVTSTYILIFNHNLFSRATTGKST
jgi:hypothetical protein